MPSPGETSLPRNGEPPEMTETHSASDAEMHKAVETLMSRLEREHAWAQELRADLDHTEQT